MAENKKNLVESIKKLVQVEVKRALQAEIKRAIKSVLKEHVRNEINSVLAEHFLSGMKEKRYSLTETVNSNNAPPREDLEQKRREAEERKRLLKEKLLASVGADSDPNLRMIYEDVDHTAGPEIGGSFTGMYSDPDDEGIDVLAFLNR